MLFNVKGAKPASEKLIVNPNNIVYVRLLKIGDYPGYGEVKRTSYFIQLGLGENVVTIEFPTYEEANRELERIVGFLGGQETDIGNINPTEHNK